MPTADTDTDLPVPVDSARTYVDVVPAGDALDPATVETHLRRLHRLGSDESTGFLSRLRGVPSLPTIEYLLADLDALRAGLASTDQENLTRGLPLSRGVRPSRPPRLKQTERRR